MGYDWESDCNRFRKVAQLYGEYWSLDTAYDNWRKLSGHQDAGWLRMPENDSDLWREWEEFNTDT